MVEAEFTFNGSKTIIQCKIEDVMNEIYNRCAMKLGKNIDDIYFIYDGKQIKENSKYLTFNQFANNMDRNRKKINFLVYDKNVNIEKNSIKKSKEIICYKCGESIRLLIKDYKIKLFGCKNGDEINNLSFEEFNKSQNIDESTIICDKCKNINKGNTFNNTFYLCNSCKINLCPLCKSKHDAKHNIIDYDLKFFICEIHNEKYFSYCKNCKKNICVLCMNEHNNHEINIYRIPDKNNKILELNKLRNKIDELNKDIKSIINILNLILQNIEIYYNICSDFIKNYEMKIMNYEKLENMNEIINEDIVNDINKIIIDNNIFKKFEKILEINNKIEKEEKKN